MCLVFLCALSAAAQDVIVKKDGNTIVCRVVELSETEVIYKRWAELQGNNYVMNLTDVSAIHYENEEKKTFNAVMAQSNSSNEQFVFSRESQHINIDDASLLAMAEKAKIKRLKKVGWSCGATMMGMGVILMASGFSLGVDGAAIFCPGIALACAAPILTIGCVVRANNLEKQIMNRVASAPVWQNDFQLKNKTTLSTQICTIQDTHKHTSTLGFGLSYQF